MKILKAMTAGLMLAALPLASHAEDMSYSFVDLGYVETEIDGVGPSADGFALRGSVGFAENYFAFAEYSSQSVSGVDLDITTVGLGGHYGLADNIDLVGRAGWFKVKASTTGASADDDGYLLSAGLRGKVGESVELDGSVIYTDVGGSGGDDTAIAVGGRYFFTKNFAVGAEYQHGSDTSTVLVGVRYSF
ncbi:MAG: porin [Gammaproteobacteria bacterium]|nr:porin [Gammaproteobacteria bacterium]